MLRTTFFARNSQQLSPVTVQFKVFSSVLALDAATGLPFPYHIQRVLDDAVNKKMNEPAPKPTAAATTTPDKGSPTKKNAAAAAKKGKKAAAEKQQGAAPPTSAAAHTMRLEPGKLKWWTPMQWAQKQCTDKDGTITCTGPKPGAASIEIGDWNYSDKSVAGKLDKLIVTHVSAMDIPIPPTKADPNDPTGTSSSSSSASSSTSTPTDEQSPQLAVLRARGGTPRDGLTGAFFTRQDLAFCLAASAQQQGFSSPFWLPASHPGLHTTPEKFLEIREDRKQPTVAVARAVVFPAKRLALGEDAARSVLSAQFIAARGTDKVCGMNACSGSTVDAASCPATAEFFRSNPEFAKDGWVSFDQIMRLGLPLLARGGGKNKVAAAAKDDDLFDGGVLIELLRQEYFNQEQLVKPGRLAMKKMPGAPAPLLKEVKK